MPCKQRPRAARTSLPSRASRLTEAARRELWDLMTVPERESWLRAHATPAELALQSLLALDPRLAAPRYRFQAHCCGYYADFLFPAPGDKLVVELDGAVHRTARAKVADAARTRELGRAGFRVLRFWNGQVRSEPAKVLNAVLAALGEIGPVQGCPAGTAEVSLEDIMVSTRPRRRTVKEA